MWKNIPAKRDKENKRVNFIPLLYAEKRPQPAFTCSKLTIETLEQGVKYVQS